MNNTETLPDDVKLLADSAEEYTTVQTPVPEDCHRFDYCGAPLCPLDSDIGDRIWYPGDPICCKSGACTEVRWVRIQKKLDRIARNRDRYFTKNMLAVIYSPQKGTLGINPDRDDCLQAEEGWVRKRGDITKKIAKARKVGLESACFFLPQA
ncbi:MAG: hypothetical protein U9M89_02755 [Patescibacteria group bacterium]|nr:hypothetical protein [Patescibacteria group bacterium]